MKNTLFNLVDYCEKESFKGYDPYDILTSPINFKLFGKWGPPIATQIMKRFPLNIRPLLGVKKGYNPKGIGLFLQAYCLLYQQTNDDKYLEKAEWLFNWLLNNYSEGFAGMCWGYNFPWANPEEYKAAWLPSVVVTNQVQEGLYQYYKITANKLAKQSIISSSLYIKKNIPVTRFNEGVSFAYTHQSKGACYNASLHAAEILARSAQVSGEQPDPLIKEAMSFVLSRQKDDGSWYYSYDPEKDIEDKQIDFHQGFILVSLHNLLELTGYLPSDTKSAIKKGIKFYKEQQFEPNGRSIWRLPARWPIDIHNQSQGIITFTMLRDYDPGYLNFAESIATWTIKNMSSPNGYFYYRITPLFKNKISYMRWSNAWMLLALTHLINIKNE